MAAKKVPGDLRWAKGRGGSGDILAITARLNELSAMYGQVFTVKIAVVDARKKSSPLCALLEWNDKVAGPRWRHHQMRTIIGAIRRRDPITGIETREYMRTTTTDAAGGVHTGYKSMKEIMRSAELRGQVMTATKSQIEPFQKKLRELTKLFKSCESRYRR